MQMYDGSLKVHFIPFVKTSFSFKKLLN